MMPSHAASAMQCSLAALAKDLSDNEIFYTYLKAVWLRPDKMATCNTRDKDGLADHFSIR